jgi:hypothetical protein
MTDWKEQLKEAYQVIRDKKKAEKPDTSTKFDSEINFKGRSGYNDTGIPLSPKTIKQKNKNKSMYAARARAKYWSAGSQLKNINDRRAAEAAAKYSFKFHGQQVPEALEFKAAPLNLEPRRNYSSSYMPGNRNYNYYDPITFDDSVEVIPNTQNLEPVFKNKIEEEIYRLKNKK